MVRQEESRGLVVHESCLIDASYTKEVWFLWRPVAGTSLWFPTMDKRYHHMVGKSVVKRPGFPFRKPKG